MPGASLYRDDDGRQASLSRQIRAGNAVKLIAREKVTFPLRAHNPSNDRRQPHRETA